jgi:hypothetical protein
MGLEAEMAPRSARAMGSVQAAFDLMRPILHEGRGRTWGFAQYLLCPALIEVSALALRRRGATRRIGIAGLLVAMAAGALMLRRDYWGSLGW